MAATSSRLVAEHLGITPGTAAKALGRLRSLGLVDRGRRAGESGRFGLSVYELAAVPGLEVVGGEAPGAPAPPADRPRPATPRPAAPRPGKPRTAARHTAGNDSSPAPVPEADAERDGSGIGQLDLLHMYLPAERRGRP